VARFSLQQVADLVRDDASEEPGFVYSSAAGHGLNVFEEDCRECAEAPRPIDDGDAERQSRVPIAGTYRFT
jgi:hypothetical protein